LRKPVALVELSSFLAGVDLHPRDFLFTTVSFLHSGVDNLNHHGTNIDTDTVAFDVRNDGRVGYVEAVILVCSNGCSFCRNLDVLIGHDSQILSV